MRLTGIHHLTAISADASGNRDFYTRVLGMRLVKKTVNQDDVSAYHVFYADGKGSPGTDLTFFDWPTPPERRGTNSIVRTALRVAGAEALAYCHARVAEAGLAHGPVFEKDGRLQFGFEDPEGSAWQSSMTAARGRPMPGRAARFRRTTRFAAWVRSP